MSATFAGLSREERVLLLNSRAEAVCIQRWRVRTVGPAPSECTRTVCSPQASELFERVAHQWSEARRARKIDVTTGTVRRLLATRARVKRVGSTLPPVSRKELLERQKQQLLPVHLSAWGDDHPSLPPPQEQTDAIDRCIATSEWFAASDLMVRLLCPGADQHPLPYTTPIDRGRRMAERYAPLLCTTTAQFHLFATIVWVLLEATAQLHATQSMAQLMSATAALKVLPQLHELHPLVVEAFYVAQKEWLAFRARGISSLTPCGVASVILTVDRTFLASGGTTEEVLVPTPPSSSQPTVCSLDRSSLHQLCITIERLFLQYNAVLLLSPLRVLRDVSRALLGANNTERPSKHSRRNDVRSGEGADGRRELREIMREASMVADVPPLLALDRESSAEKSLSFLTTLDIADTVSYLSTSLLMGGASVPKVLELSKGNRNLLERWLSLRCTRLAAKANQRGPGMSWYLQRLLRPSIVKSAVGGTPGSPRVTLTVQHADGTKTELGDPREITGDPSVAVNRRRDRPEDLLEGVPWNQVTESCVEQFIRAAVQYGQTLRKTQTPVPLGQHLSAAKAQAASSPMLCLMENQWLVPVHSAVLQFVLQCHPESKYITGCGVRSLYVNGEGRLVVERVCYMFCVWDYRLSFKSKQNDRSSGSARVLREPRAIWNQGAPLPVPRGVLTQLTRKEDILGMLTHYRDELRKCLAERPDAVPDGRMYLHDDEALAVKYILSHHPRYFARRGCGVKNIFVTLDDRSATFCVPHEVAGLCHVLRYCDSTVTFNIFECFGEGGKLNGADVLVDPTELQRKRERSGQ